MSAAPSQFCLRRLLGVLPVVVLTALTGVAAVSAPQATPVPGARAVSWGNGSPVGELSSTRIRPGGLQVVGWDLDPNSAPTALSTWARVDGRWVRSTSIANRPVAAVAKAHPAAGPDHGFQWVVPVPEGHHQVCIGAHNLGRGQDSVLGCVTKNFDYGPIGHIDSIQAAKGAVQIVGWAYDNDSPKTALTMTVTVDGTKHSVLADRSRTDVEKHHPWIGPDHGFAVTYPIAQGSHRVCVTATNIGFGTNTSLGCTAFVLDESPVGALNTVDEQKGKLHVRGWTFDPDVPQKALDVLVSLDGHAPKTVLADARRQDVGAAHRNAGPDHGFDLLLPAAEGTHRVCVTAVNVSFGSNVSLGCRTYDLNFTPAAAITSLSPRTTGVLVHGWAEDPDTSKPITVRLSIDGGPATTLAADHPGRRGSAYRGRQFSDFVNLTSGTRQICVVAINVLYGTHNSKPACRAVTLELSPLGTFSTVSRSSGSNNLLVTGWTFDPDTTKPIRVAATVDGKPAGTYVANATNTAPTRDYPKFGSKHGISATIAASSGEHTVCLTALNVSGGSNLSLGCKLIIAVHPVAPGSPGKIHVVPGFGGATVSWAAPATDGGAPVSTYTVTASPGGATSTVPASSLSTTILGLKSKTAYTFTVTAANLAGSSVGAASSPVTTTAGPPAQRTPAHVSTSRYIRNADDASPSELATMRAEGRTDALSNPSGHGYLVLLDIGGQDQYDGGVVLSAGIRFVTYANLVKDLDAYVDGYHSAQRSSAPVTIALGTNNDMSVNATAGRAWANSVVDPVRTHAGKYLDMTIAGADDIEPGFRASYSQSKAWLGGFLGATPAPFVFNGSADGCSWSVTNSRCNNGWTMSGLQYLAGGAAPTRILDLPQIYNSAMAGQWKYISLTGIVDGGPRINFAGPLTELTACRQAGGCGSMSGHAAWTDLWNDLQSDSRLRVASLPYSTDLRIDS